MASSKSKAQALTLLGDLTDSVDSLPHDLTKSFGDLRELDAVLRTSMQTITNKIHQLIDVMHDPAALPATRLKLLLEIAEDAQRLRLGSDDKIRVVSKTADDIIAHNAQNKSTLSLLASLDPAFQSALYVRQTAFPHVAPSNLVLPNLDSTLYGANGRRKRVPTTNNAYGYGNQANGSVGIAARVNTLASAPMTITGSSQNANQKKRRLEDVDTEQAVRRTPLKSRDKEKDAEAAKDKSKKKPSRTVQRSLSPSDDRVPPQRSSSSRQQRHSQHDHSHHASTAQYRPFSSDFPQPQQLPPSHAPASHHQSNSHHRPRIPEMQQQPHYRQPLHQEGPPLPPQAPPPLNYRPNHPNPYSPYPPNQGHPPNDPGYTYYPPRTHTSHSNHAGGQPPPLNVPPDRRSSKSTGTTSLLDTVANRTADFGHGHGRTMTGGSNHGPATTFDEDDYERRSGGNGARSGPSNINSGGRVMAGHRGRSQDGIGTSRGAMTGERPSEAGATGQTTGSGVNASAATDVDDKLYCYCRQQSYGEMIGCEDKNCKTEWFHLGCLEMSAPPKGSWFCNECRGRKDRERRGKVTKSSRVSTQSTGNANNSQGQSSASARGGSSGAGGRSTSANGSGGGSGSVQHAPLPPPNGPGPAR